jgi:hypothetical protein
MAINSFPPSGDGPIQIPDQLIDPVSKFRVSNPENLIDTDFEYGLQPTKWETVELINNTPSFFSKSGDTTIDGISSIITNAGTREIIVKTELDHGLAVGIPINVTGTKSITADGAYIINSIPDTKTFTYLCKDNQTDTNSILDLYSSIITGEFFQGSQLRISDSDGIVTDAEGTSLLTVTTNTTHGFGENTPFYFLNLNSTVAQEFQAANTASKSFDASNSATAQTFDGSNSLSSVNIDWSNSATFGGTVSNITESSIALDTITVSHTNENFNNLPLGAALYYSVSTTSGYFNTNPRGVVFLKPLTGETSQLGTLTSTFQVSLVPNGDAINITSSLSGTFQIANQSRTFAGNNINPLTQTIINVEVGTSYEFDGGNQGYNGAVIPTDPPNNTLTVNSYDGTEINAEGSSASDHYVGSMVRYTSSGSAATGLTANDTYFITSFTNNGLGNYTFSVAALPGGTPISIPSESGSGIQAFSKIGISIDKDIVHIRNSNFSEGDMIEYTFPVDGRFDVSDPEEEKVFYFVDTAYDAHNYKLGEDIGFKPIVATGGTLLPEIYDKGRFWRVHQFTSVGSTNFVVSDIGKEGIVEYLVVGGGGGGGPRGGGGGAGGMLEGTFTVTQTTYPVVVGAGGAQSTDSATGGSANSGQNSSVFGITANGGGAGGIFGTPGSNGASGGGAGRDNLSNASISTGISGQGFPGGGGSGNPSSNGCAGGGGGGGAGGPGQRGRTNFGGQSAFFDAQELGGQGGSPRASNITGTITYYAGGGGGGAACVLPDSFSLRTGFGGGIASVNQRGGGGNGSVSARSGLSRAATAGAANTGGGGGGGGDDTGFGGGTHTGAPGGSGVVIIRYPITPPVDFVPATATGGTVSETISSGILYRVHTFTNTGGATFTVQNAGSWNRFEYLVVGGGGNGEIQPPFPFASIANGGGGGGGVRQGALSLESGVGYSVNVGGATQTSTFATITSAAGGNAPNGSGATGGGGQSHQGNPGNTGAGGQGNVPVTSPAQGFNGGAGHNAGAGGSPERGGGGGGAGAPGQAGNVVKAGDGGSGAYSEITGQFRYYGGGGGGSTRSASLGIDNRFGLGGFGGGGNGANGTSTRAPSGQPNTGGGGGAYTSFGGQNTPITQAGAGAGGSGIVVVRYPIAILTAGEFITATGGEVSTTTVGNTKYAVHSFTRDGSDNFRVLSLGSVSGNNQLEYLVVAGGGGGGNATGTNWGAGGGGGGGGVLSGSATAIAQTYPVFVGFGGSGGPQGARDNSGSNGSNSTAFGLTAIGGGKGGNANFNGNSGGSGGGAGYVANRQGGAGTAGPPRQGFNGGNANVNEAGGGGGGASQAGANGTSNSPGRGGNGVSSSITGVAMVYGGGGGGGYYNANLSAALGGTGGGGNGGQPSTIVSNNGSSGTPNTGGGGGGGSGAAGLGDAAAGAGGQGGSGIVIVRYPIGTVV